MQPSIQQSKMAQEINDAFLVSAILLVSAVFSVAEGATLDAWIDQNLKNLKPQDAALIEAENGGEPKVIKVKRNGGGDFKTVAAAVDSIPMYNTKRVVIWIGGGEYYEKIAINYTKNFVTLYGDPNDMPTIVYDGTAKKFGTMECATVMVHSDYFIAANIAFVNSAPEPNGAFGQQAVALKIDGDKGAFYNCRFIGFQDTLCDDDGKHFYKDCYIEGTYDFIFGKGKSIYLNTRMHSVAKELGVITAQARESVKEDSGYAFLFCQITGTGTNTNTTFLGRAWKPMPNVIYAYTQMDSVVKSEGWSVYTNPERSKTVYFGEHLSTGPGINDSGRAKFAKVLSAEEVKSYTTINYIDGAKWLLPPPSFVKSFTKEEKEQTM